MGVRTWRRDLRARSLGLLESLGSDATEVSRRLGAAAVRGHPGDPEGCAIAVFLSPVMAADPMVRGVRVTARTVRLSVRRGLRFGLAVRLPEPVRCFVDGFDQGRYPELVAPMRLRLPATSMRTPCAHDTPPASPQAPT